MFPEVLSIMVEDLFEACVEQNLTLALAESCTGGLISGCITSVAGASKVFDRGFITYTNQAKTDMLGVPVHMIEEHGAVSENVARAMAEGALRHSNASLSAAVTGIAGPDGGSPQKPVGLVHIACARKGFETRHERHVFKGTSRNKNESARARIRIQAVESALRLLNQMVMA